MPTGLQYTPTWRSSLTRTYVKNVNDIDTPINLNAQYNNSFSAITGLGEYKTSTFTNDADVTGPTTNTSLQVQNTYTCDDLLTKGLRYRIKRVSVKVIVNAPESYMHDCRLYNGIANRNQYDKFVTYYYLDSKDTYKGIVNSVYIPARREFEFNVDLGPHSHQFVGMYDKTYTPGSSSVPRLFIYPFCEQTSGISKNTTLTNNVPLAGFVGIAFRFNNRYNALDKISVTTLITTEVVYAGDETIPSAINDMQYFDRGEIPMSSMSQQQINTNSRKPGVLKFVI